MQNDFNMQYLQFISALMMATEAIHIFHFS